MVDNTQTTQPNGSFTIQPPDQFDFTKPLKWETWIRRFERFRIASGLSRTSSENQVNTLIYCVGGKSDDILQTLNLIVKASERVYYDKYEQKIETGVEYESFNFPQPLQKKKQ